MQQWGFREQGVNITQTQYKFKLLFQPSAQTVLAENTTQNCIHKKINKKKKRIEMQKKVCICILYFTAAQPLAVLGTTGTSTW